MSSMRVTSWMLVFAGVAVFSAPALAQTGSISGQVRDNSGGAIPGVSVEATSPALIEGSRVAVTDGQGKVLDHFARTGDLCGEVFAQRFSFIHSWWS